MPSAGLADDYTSLLLRLVFNPYAPEDPSPLACCGSTLMYVDPESFAPYYYEPRTDESLWEKPPAWSDDLAVVVPLAVLVGVPRPAGPDGVVPPPRKWCVYKDPKYWLQYFVNCATGESLWLPPSDICDQVMVGPGAEVAWSEEEGQEEAPALPQPPASPAPAAQPSSRRRSSLGDAATMLVKARVAAMVPLGSVAPPGPGLAFVRGWMVLLDKTTGVIYYALSDAMGGTLGVQWDVPADVLAAAEDEWEALPSMARFLSREEEEEAEEAVATAADVALVQEVALGAAMSVPFSPIVPPAVKIPLARQPSTASTRQLTTGRGPPPTPMAAAVAGEAGDGAAAQKIGGAAPAGPATMESLLSHILGGGAEGSAAGAGQAVSLPAWALGGSTAPSGPEGAADWRSVVGYGLGSGSRVVRVHRYGPTKEQRDAADAAEAASSARTEASASAATAESAADVTTAAPSTSAPLPTSLDDVAKEGREEWAKGRVDELALSIAALEAEEATLASASAVPGSAAAGRRSALAAELAAKRAQAAELSTWLADAQREAKKRAAAAERASTATAMAGVLAIANAELAARRKEIAAARVKAAEGVKAKTAGVVAARRASAVASKEAAIALEASLKKEGEEAVKATKARVAAGRAAVEARRASMSGSGTGLAAVIAAAGSPAATAGSSTGSVAGRRGSLVGAAGVGAHAVGGFGTRHA
jgi:hypothetical protein